jgi:hypothetical protein
MPFVWTPQCQEAFDGLKERLVNSPILTLPRDEFPFLLDTDASNCSTGAVLSQLVGGEERVVAYYKPERNYCVTHRELLSVVQAVRRFHVYLYGRRFTLRTDHSSLQWLMNFREPEGQMCRWLQNLQSYDFEILHRAGKQHGNADALSRRPCLLQSCKHCANAENKTHPPVERVSRAVVVPDLLNRRTQKLPHFSAVW